MPMPIGSGYSAALPFQGANMLYMYMPLEEALQSEGVGISFSVDSVNFKLHPRWGEYNSQVGLQLENQCWDKPTACSKELTLATHMDLTTCTSSHLALRFGWRKKKEPTTNFACCSCNYFQTTLKIPVINTLMSTLDHAYSNYRMI